MIETQFVVAILTVRLLAGILFLFQGYDKVFNIGVNQVYETMRATLSGRNIPFKLIYFTAAFTSYIELVCGFMLIIGFFKFYSVYLLCLNLIVVSIGFSLAKPMWESMHVVFRLALLIFILVTPPSWDVISFDYLFKLSGLNSP